MRKLIVVVALRLSSLIFGVRFAQALARFSVPVGISVVSTLAHLRSLANSPLTAYEDFFTAVREGLGDVPGDVADLDRFYTASGVVVGGVLADQTAGREERTL